MNSTPKPFGSLVGLAAGWFISVGIYEMMKFGSCSTPAGPGEVPCPPGTTKYFFYVFFGIIVAMGSIVAGGSWLSFAAIFGGVGLGAIRAGLSETGEAWFLLFGASFFLTPVVLVVSMVLVGAKRIRAARLLSHGHQGTGTVLSVEDTGITINNNPRVRMRFRIEPDDGITAPFEATKTATVPRIAVPRVGDRHPVWFDPMNHESWMFAQGTPAEGPVGLKKIVEMARQGARPSVPPPATG